MSEFIPALCDTDEGSDYGFNHGPALGEYVAARIIDGGAIDPRFTLATKATSQKRTVY